jgi:hypothetical protein
VKSRRPPSGALAAAVAMLGLVACTSQPSVRSVVNSSIETLDTTQATKDCMLGVVEGYTDDELLQMSSENPGFNSADPDLTNATPQFQEYTAALAACDTDR